MAYVTSTLDELFANDLQDQEFQEIYRRQKPLYDLVAEIISRRLKLGLTQKDLAKLAKTFQSRVSKIESGEHDFRISTIVRIAEALETEVSIRLIPFEEARNKDQFTTEDFYKIINSQMGSKLPSVSYSGDFEEPALSTEWSSSVPESNLAMEEVL